MNRTPRLSKSGIDYLDLAWNFYSGCHNWSNGICPLGKNCWAMKRTQRFKQYYPNGFEPTFYPEAVLSPLYVRKPSRIGVAFMGDLFGDWMKGKAVRSPDGELWSGQGIMESILRTIEGCPQHTFLFLTKCPWNLHRWSPFPENCWVGATATDSDMALTAMNQLSFVQASIRFLSLEPLLGEMGWVFPPLLNGLDCFRPDWLIIGAQTNPYRPPKPSWVWGIIEAASEAGIPVFLKDNLRWHEQRREWPRVEVGDEGDK